MRVLIVFTSISYLYNYIFVRVSLIGGCIVSLICLCQSDMKSLVAYSSVAHIGLIIGGLITFSY